MDTAGLRGSIQSQQSLAVAALGLLALAGWLLQHPFNGMGHDSLLYTQFALARLHPDTLGWDVVMRVGSQDRFTLFTPLYLTAIKLLGVEHAAALLLFLSEAALCVFAWLVARSLMSRLDATLGIALLVTVPSVYGSRAVFHFIENFLTPRMPAEALVVGAVAAALRGRYRIAAGAVVAAMLLHPIMGAVGAVFLTLGWVAPLRPKMSLVAAAAGFVTAVGTVVAIAPLGRLTDPDWMRAVVTENDYLFVSSWSLEDWSGVAVPLALLAIGWSVGATPLLRRLCVTALGTVMCGMLVTLVFADIFHVWLMITLQAWRWLWLADVLAIGLAPAIIQDCWRRGDSGRVAVIVLAIACVFRGLGADLLAVAAALALAVAPLGLGQSKHWRLLFIGACVALGMGIFLTLIDRFMYLSQAVPVRDIFMNEVRAVCSDGIVPIAVIILAWAALNRSSTLAHGRTLTLAQIVVAAVFCVWLAPYSWRTYTHAYYTPELASRFAPWRAEIPSHAEVLWPDSALATWFLLERPSYWSTQQVAGGIFSKQFALLMERRTASVRDALIQSNLLPVSGSREEVVKTWGTMIPVNVSHIDLKAMVALCADPDLQYIVSGTRLAPTLLPPVILDPSKASGRLYLYRCGALRN